MLILKGWLNYYSNFRSILRFGLYLILNLFVGFKFTTVFILGVSADGGEVHERRASVLTGYWRGRLQGACERSGSGWQWDRSLCESPIFSLFLSQSQSKHLKLESPFVFFELRVNEIPEFYITAH